jgi:hypothetical protein
MISKQMIFGISSFIPGISRLFLSHPTGGSCGARYCYTVWLRHLITAHRCGLLTTPPRVFAELGPGDSLGIGIAALLSGAEQYYAFDVVEYASNVNNLRIFDEIVELFRNRTPVPGDDEFPRVRPRLDDYGFPEELLPAGLLEQTLSQDRIERLRHSLVNINGPESAIKYLVPWSASSNFGMDAADMILSQAVMQYVDNLEEAYQGFNEWLRVGGIMSHVIDFSSHCYLDEWNGQYAYSPLAWKMLRGKRPYFINRVPCSNHVDFMEQAGFTDFNVTPEVRKSDITRDKLNADFQKISDDDLCMANALIQAVKTGR